MQQRASAPIMGAGPQWNFLELRVTPKSKIHMNPLYQELSISSTEKKKKRKDNQVKPGIECSKRQELKAIMFKCFLEHALSVWNNGVRRDISLF